MVLQRHFYNRNEVHMTVYEWKPMVSMPVDPQIAGRRLEELSAARGGVTPAEVVEDASPPGSVLHPIFEWDDTKAAKAHREDQARHMLRSIRVVIERPEQEPIVTRGFVVIEREGEGRVYDQVEIVMSDAKLRQQVVDRALKELSAWMERYNGYVELSSMYGAIKSTMGRKKRRQPRSEDRPPA
jgi:hypothetical protein